VAAPSPAALEASLRESGFQGGIRVEEPLAAHTTWRIGGPADLLVEPASREDLCAAIRWAAERGVPWRILGNGSNLLVPDEGVRGLVVRVRRVLDAVRVEGGRVEAGAGASLPAVSKLCASRGLQGLEFGAGIPGTVGGAVVMNAGWHEFEIGSVVRSVEFLEPDGASRTFDKEACGFGYRRSAFRGRPGVVLGAVLELVPGDRIAVESRLEGFASSRKANQPTERPSCGSVFLKPAGDFAGRLIEAAGLKGMRVGGVEVSRKHANFFVNVGNATCSDVLQLVERVEREVESRFAVKLEREFELWEPGAFSGP
jgi:UDP-N-acetylmuramate dehydrogenase